MSTQQGKQRWWDLSNSGGGIPPMRASLASEQRMRLLVTLSICMVSGRLTDQ